MSNLNVYGEEGLKIHYFLLNNGFEYINGRIEDIDDEKINRMILPKYQKDNIEISFDPSFREFKVRESGNIVFEIINNSKDTGIDMDEKDWRIFSTGSEIKVEDIIPYF